MTISHISIHIPVVVAPPEITSDLRFEEMEFYQRFLRRPYRLKTPLDIMNAHRKAGFAVVPIPLKQHGGFMVFNVSYEPPMTIHPVALYDHEGAPCRFPTKETVSDPSGRLVYMLSPRRPIRTRQDVVTSIEDWTRRYVDTTPAPFAPF